MIARWITVSFVALSATSLSAQRTQVQQPTLRVASLTGPLRLDGRLDEPAWSTSDSIGSLTEIEPREGAAPFGRTVVRVLAGADEIVIGVRADDAEPGRLVSFARERDAPLANEDHRFL